jgi:hypothetical protein
MLRNILAQDTILVGGHSTKPVLAGIFPEVFVIFLPAGTENLPTSAHIDLSNLEAVLHHELMAGLFPQQKTMNRHLTHGTGVARSDLERAKIAATHVHALLRPKAACGGLPGSGVINYGQPVIAITREANGSLLLHGRDDLKSGVRKIIDTAEGWDGLRYAAAFQRAKEKAEAAARRLQRVCNRTSGCVRDFGHTGHCSMGSGPPVLTAETVGELSRDQLREECKARDIPLGLVSKAVLQERLIAALAAEAGAVDGGQQDAGMEE